MRDFKHVQDLEEWMEPMGYEEFWVKLAPFGVDAEIRANCDLGIARGGSPETMLATIKSLTRIELTKELGLKRRPITPWVQLVENH
ncbi:MAG: hypothetical protein ACSHXB_19275 [Sulfitobacter sp.]